MLSLEASSEVNDAVEAYRLLLGRTARAAKSSRSAPVATAASRHSTGVGRRRRARTVTNPPAITPVTNHHMRSSILGGYLSAAAITPEHLVDRGQTRLDRLLLTKRPGLVQDLGRHTVGKILLFDHPALEVM